MRYEERIGELGYMSKEQIPAKVGDRMTSTGSVKNIWNTEKICHTPATIVPVG